MKTKNLITRFFAIAVIATTLFSCSNDEGTVAAKQKSIVELAQADPNLSILVQALTRANLVADVSVPGPITVFAPTNTAFTNFLQAKGFANLEAVPVDVLKQILLNHVVVGNVKAADLPASGYFKTLATFGTTTSKISNFVTKTTTGGVTTVNINGASTNFGANVTSADVPAANGTVHVVNGVIAVPTIVNHAIANPALSTLVAIVTSATGGAFGDQSAVLGVLGGATAAAPLTVFAPTNAAFATATGPGGFANGATPAQVSNVLRYHVVVGANVLAATLMNGQVVPTAFTPQTFTVTLTGGAKITDKSTTQANIILTDIQGSNGVVHAVDKVLQPTL
jgi:uncharacterized surface protein with fasciclin (FAS1) repeats